MKLRYIPSTASSFMSDGYLAHHGIKGQKWGVRRFRNEDGSLTKAGKERYGFKGTGKTRNELNAEVKQLREEGYQKASKKLGVDKLKAEASEYAKRNGLDEDDGGGGDPKAGAKYWKMQEKINRMDEKAYESAAKYAQDALNSKYGDQTFEKLLQKNNQIATGQTVAAVALTALGVATIKNMRSKRFTGASIDWDKFHEGDGSKGIDYDEPFWGNPKLPSGAGISVDNDEPFWGNPKSSRSASSAIDRSLEENKDNWGNPKSSSKLSSLRKKTRRKE